MFSNEPNGRGPIPMGAPGYVIPVDEYVAKSNKK